MLFLLKEGYGDYEDYYEHVVAVLDVDTEKTIDVLNKEHQDFLIQLMADNNIPIHPGQPWALKGRTKAGVRKLHKQLRDANDFLIWLKATYPYTEITNFVEHTI